MESREFIQQLCREDGNHKKNNEKLMGSLGSAFEEEEQDLYAIYLWYI